MNEFGKRGSNTNLKSDIGLGNLGNVYWNMTPAELVEDTILLGEGIMTDSGAIAVDTGTFTGRSPEDRFIVCDEKTENTVWWGKVNKKFDADKFDALYNRMKAYLTDKDMYVRDSYACADDDYRMNIRVVTELPWSNMFAYNMFLRPTDEEIKNFKPEWHVVCAPNFMADPEIDGTRQSNFAVINFTKKMIIIGGTGYTGEIKKGIFSVLNYVLPFEKDVLSMHCSANVGKDGDTAIFFGLSGTGKTTLSSDEDRRLIGDDEHGWADNGSVFNFEGGCYAKTINLSAEKEPQIYDAIKFGAILENIGFHEDSSTPDYDCDKITQNTRVSYPIHHIDNIMVPSKGNDPKNIFFLTCDAFGVLPPISKLTSGQAMYHFISGYTAKVAGTEAGITEPQTVFSACFGAPFLPLHPTKYAEMLGNKIESNDVNVWLVNTGWSGGAYGTGSRMKLKYTRSLITAALTGELDKVDYITDEIFGLNMPTSCPDVPTEILNPVNTWEDKAAFDKKANELAQAFVKNFETFESNASEEILSAAPKVMVK
ncbi:phosphoenolpyruvate carboxykinase (ATP) [Brumimicrobium mesophilum]|uniref:phosphoenolpyruvate carboxykinase (ATP) n=1 Tax=Brumimicrobium mesophilum TaxID=392717 RepID=UPI000D141E10|nr:phosphoenolpyruvate carboxykinase (ATP) [Brumimicrobium mesophilum]